MLTITRRFIAVGAITAIVITGQAISPARADWQFTKWGMSPAELQKASSVKVFDASYCPTSYDNYKKADGNPKKTIFASDWNVGSMSFKACYVFVNNKLDKIDLFPVKINEEAEEAIIKGLSQKYGSPSVNKRLQEIGLVTYVWDLPNEKVIFYIYSHSVSKLPYSISFSSKAFSDETAVRDGL